MKFEFEYRTRVKKTKEWSKWRPFPEEMHIEIEAQFAKMIPPDGRLYYENASTVADLHKNFKTLDETEIEIQRSDNQANKFRQRISQQ